MSRPDFLDLTNVQGDILVRGLPKTVELFWFFTIGQGEEKDFCQVLPKLALEIDNTAQALGKWKAIDDLKLSGGGVVPVASANIAFSAKGIAQLSKALKTPIDVAAMENPCANFGTPFGRGMQADADRLGDPLDNGTPTWRTELLKEIHGVILVCASTEKLALDKLNRMCALLNTVAQPPNAKAVTQPQGDKIAKQVAFITGKVRPGELRGREHFGFEDGISEPAIKGVDINQYKVLNGQDQIAPGIVLCARDGDVPKLKVSGGPRGDQKADYVRPRWMLDGSFMVFRQLEQDVFAWNTFLRARAAEQRVSTDLVGARLMGRWKSGCPVQLSPTKDDPTIGTNEDVNNVFTFDPFAGTGNPDTKCPVFSHIRKTFPRNDLPQRALDTARIIRRGIPYGNEVDADPTGTRGLLFVSYQSDITHGFQFMQEDWCNNANFRRPNTGLDPVVGQMNKDPTNTRSPPKQVGILGLDPAKLTTSTLMDGINPFVKPKGGEYFFMPSMTALKQTFTNVK